MKQECEFVPAANQEANAMLQSSVRLLDAVVRTLTPSQLAASAEALKAGCYPIVEIVVSEKHPAVKIYLVESESHTRHLIANIAQGITRDET